MRSQLIPVILTHLPTKSSYSSKTPRFLESSDLKRSCPLTLHKLFTAQLGLDTVKIECPYVAIIGVESKGGYDASNIVTVRSESATTMWSAQKADGASRCIYIMYRAPVI